MSKQSQPWNLYRGILIALFLSMVCYNLEDLIMPFFWIMVIGLIIVGRAQRARGEYPKTPLEQNEEIVAGIKKDIADMQRTINTAWVAAAKREIDEIKSNPYATEAQLAKAERLLAEMDERIAKYGINENTQGTE